MSEMDGTGITMKDASMIDACPQFSCAVHPSTHASPYFDYSLRLTVANYCFDETVGKLVFGILGNVDANHAWRSIYSVDKSLLRRSTFSLCNIHCRDGFLSNISPNSAITF